VVTSSGWVICVMLGGKQNKIILDIAASLITAVVCGIHQVKLG